MTRFLDEYSAVHNFRSDPKASFGKIVPYLMSTMTSLRRYDFSFYGRKMSTEEINSVLPLKAEFDIVSQHDPAYSGIAALESAEVMLVVRDCIEALLTERFSFYIGVNVIGLSEYIFDWCGIPKGRDLRNFIFKNVHKKFKPKKAEKSSADPFGKVTDPKSLCGIKVLLDFIEKDVLTLGDISRLVSTSASSSSSSSSAASSKTKMGMSQVLSGLGSYISANLSTFRSAASSSPSVITSLTTSSSAISLSSSSSSSSSVATAAECALPAAVEGDVDLIINNPIFKLYELSEALSGTGFDMNRIVINPFIYAEQCKGFIFKAFEGTCSTLGDSLKAICANSGKTLAEGYRYDDIVTTKEHPTSAIGLVISVDVLSGLAQEQSCGNNIGGSGSGKQKGVAGASTGGGPGAGGQGSGGPTALAGFARDRLCGGKCGDFRPMRRVLVCTSMNSWVPMKIAAQLWRHRIHTEIVTGSKSTGSFMPTAHAKMADWVVEVEEGYTRSEKVRLRKIDKTTASKSHLAMSIAEAVRAIIREALFNDYVAASPDPYGRGVHAFTGPEGYTASSPPPQVSGRGGKSGGGGGSGGRGSGGTGSGSSLWEPAEEKFKVSVLGSRPKAWVDKNIASWKKQLVRGLEGIHFEGPVPCFALELPLEEIYEIIDKPNGYMENMGPRGKGKKGSGTEDMLRNKYHKELIESICSVRDQTIIVISFSSKSTIQFTVLGQARISSIQKEHRQPRNTKGKTKKHVLPDYS